MNTEIIKILSEDNFEITLPEEKILITLKKIPINLFFKIKTNKKTFLNNPIDSLKLLLTKDSFERVNNNEELCYIILEKIITENIVGIDFRDNMIKELKSLKSKNKDLTFIFIKKLVKENGYKYLELKKLSQREIIELFLIETEEKLITNIINDLELEKEEEFQKEELYNLFSKTKNTNVQEEINNL